jgi:Protein of unknown function (DUF1360)
MTETLQSADPFAGYSDEEQPLEGYALLTAVFGTAMAVTLFTADRRGRIPERFRLGDVAAMGLATHKISRLLTRDAVTSFVRAPFVHLEEKSGTNSLDERPRGHGLRRSMGELLSCPECTGQWVAGGLLGGLLHAPRQTRAITALYSALTVADLLQYVYTGLKRRA